MLGSWGWLNTLHPTPDRRHGQQLISHSYTPPGGGVDMQAKVTFRNGEKQNL